MKLLEKIDKYLEEKNKQELNEGIWALPNNDKNIAELIKLFKKPLLAKMASKATWNIIGSDSFHDLINAIAEKDPNEDLRPLIAYYASNRFGTGDWLPDNLKVKFINILKPFENDAKKSKNFDFVDKKLKTHLKFPNS